VVYILVPHLVLAHERHEVVVDELLLIMGLVLHDVADNEIVVELDVTQDDEVEVVDIEQHDETHHQTIIDDMVVIYLENMFGMPHDEVDEAIHDIVYLVVEVAEVVIELLDVMPLATEVVEVEDDVLVAQAAVLNEEMVVNEYST